MFFHGENFLKTNANFDLFYLKRLVKSQVGEQRDMVISGYIANDVLGCSSDLKQGVLDCFKRTSTLHDFIFALFIVEAFSD